MINFGTGKLIAVPTQDALGNTIANPTPVVLGVLQDVSVDLSVELKTLYGSNRYPIAVGQGKAKPEIKAKYADISGAALGSLFFGKAATAGIRGVAFDVAGQVPAGSTYTVTPTVPNSGTFIADLGVVDVLTGAQLVRVASTPAAGQYSVSTAGVYTFGAPSASKHMLFSFEYSASSTSGQIFNMTNDLMGYTPSFSILLQSSYQGKTLITKFSKATSGKLSLPMKNDDFTISEFEATAYDDGTGSIGYIAIF
jgi:hypothetical protein